MQCSICLGISAQLSALYLGISAWVTSKGIAVLDPLGVFECKSTRHTCTTARFPEPMEEH